MSRGLVPIYIMMYRLYEEDSCYASTNPFGHVNRGRGMLKP